MNCYSYSWHFLYFIGYIEEHIGYEIKINILDITTWIWLNPAFKSPKKLRESTIEQYSDGVLDSHKITRQGGEEGEVILTVGCLRGGTRAHAPAAEECGTVWASAEAAGCKASCQIRPLEWTLWRQKRTIAPCWPCPQPLCICWPFHRRVTEECPDFYLNSE